MRRVLRLGLIAVSAAAALFVAATPASAVPTGCVSGALTPNGAFSYCSGGTGWHRISVLCRVNPYYTYWWGGPVVGPGQISTVYCNPNETRVDYVILTGN
jgi:hypothetical protein